MSKKKKNVLMSLGKKVGTDIINYEQKQELYKNENLQLKEENLALEKRNKELKAKADSFDIDQAELIKISNDLNKAESFLDNIAARHWEMAWAIGYLLRQIEIKHSDVISNKYSNISQYAQTRFSIEPKTAQRFMFISEHFDIETARSFGSKLRLLQPLDKQKREMYLEWIKKENPTFREIEERLKDEKGKTSTVGKHETIEIKKNTISVKLDQLGFNIPKDKYERLKSEITELLKKYSDKK